MVQSVLLVCFSTSHSGTKCPFGVFFNVTQWYKASFWCVFQRHTVVQSVLLVCFSTSHSGTKRPFGVFSTSHSDTKCPFGVFFNVTQWYKASFWCVFNLCFMFDTVITRDINIFKVSGIK